MSSIVADFRSALWNARYVWLPAEKSERHGESVMTGALPGTEMWKRFYPKASKEMSLSQQWQLFGARHAIAKERSKNAWRIFYNEVIELITSAGPVPISLARPDIKLAACVGGSMTGYDFEYMDLVTVIPTEFSDPVVTPFGEPHRDEEGRDVYNEFCINFGNGCLIEPGDFVELKYNESVISNSMYEESKNSGIDLKALRKIRNIRCLKIRGDEKFIGVNFKRFDEITSGEDHPISNLTGRIFGQYKRNDYEFILRQKNIFDELSFLSRYPEIIKPDFYDDPLFNKLGKNIFKKYISVVVDSRGDPIDLDDEISTTIKNLYLTYEKYKTIQHDAA